MNNVSDTTPVCSQNGRKGVSYDWQSLYAAAEVQSIDSELRALAPALR